MAPDERSEKQAAAQQAVDILHEISTILVGFTGGGPTCTTMRGSRFTDRAWSPPTELSFGPQDIVNLHLHDRERRQPRSTRGKFIHSSTQTSACPILTDFRNAHPRTAERREGVAHRSARGTDRGSASPEMTVGIGVVLDYEGWIFVASHGSLGVWGTIS